MITTSLRYLLAVGLVIGVIEGQAHATQYHFANTSNLSLQSASWSGGNTPIVVTNQTMEPIVAVGGGLVDIVNGSMNLKPGIF